MTRQRLICLLAGIVVSIGAFAWLNVTNAVHPPATYFLEYQLEPRTDQPMLRSVPAELRFGAGPDESAHGVAAVQLGFPNVVTIRPMAEHEIRVIRVGRKSEAARDSEVWINQALADGKTQTPAILGNIKLEGSTVELREPGACAVFRGTFQIFELHLLRHECSGVVRIQADDSDPIEIDLYSPQRAAHTIRFAETIASAGSHSVSASTPNRAIHRLSLRTMDPNDRFRVVGLLVQTGRKVRRIPIPESPPHNQWRFHAPGGLSARRHHLLTWTHVVAALLLGWGAATTLTRLTAPRSAARDTRVPGSGLAAAIVVALLAAQSAFWLAAAWPAFLSTDSFAVWQQSQDLYIETWLSHTYVLFVLLTRQLWDSLAALSIIQVALTFVIAAGIFLGLLRRGLRLAAVVPFLLLFVTAIPIGAYAMYHTRDTLFGLIGVAIAAVVYFWGWGALYRPPCAPSRPALLALALLAGWFATLRAEGALLLGLLPLALWLVVRLPPRHVAAFTLVSVGLWYALGTPLLRALRIQPSPFYGLTTKLDPLGAIVTGPYNTDDPDRDRAIIEKIVPLDRLQQRHRNIEVYWDGTIDSSRISLEDLKAFDHLYSTLVRKNPVKFLANRWDNFARLCCSDDQFNLGGVLNLSFGPQMDAHMHEMGLNEHAFTPCPQLHDFLSRLLSISLQPGQTPIDWRSIIWNLWPGVTLTILSILAFRRIPVTATAALLVGYHIAVIFVAAPASMFKYLYDVYFLGFFLVPMALLELGARSPRLALLFMRRTNP